MLSRKIIYLNENLERIGIISKELYIYAKLNKTLNEASTLDLEIISTANTKKTVDKTRFIIVFDGSEHRFFRAVNISIGNTISITGSDVGFDDYASNPVVTSVSLGTPDNVILKTKPSDYTINKIGEFDPQFLNGSMLGYGGYKYSEIGTSLDNLRNVIGSYETITFDFSVKFNGNVITKYLNLYSNYAIDTDEVKYRYTYGVNAKDIIKEENSSDTFTAAVGLGFNTNEDFLEEEYDYLKDNEDIPLTFENVEWKVSKGDPVDKPFGQNYVEVPSSTKAVSLLYGKPRKKIIRYTDTTVAGAVLRKTYDELILNTRPKVQFRIASDLFFDTGTKWDNSNYVTIGDYVAIIRNDINIKYRTRIFKLTQDLLISKYIDLEFGDVLFENRAKQMKDYKKETAKVDKKVDKNIARIKQLEQTIRDLNDRINNLEEWTDMPKDEVEVIEHSPASYFTYVDSGTGGLKITGLSEIGSQALLNGVTQNITTPLDYEGQPIDALKISRVNMPNGIFRITSNILSIEQIAVTVKHLIIDEGPTYIYRFEGLNVGSGFVRVPDSLTKFADSFLFWSTNLKRVSVPYFMKTLGSYYDNYFEYTQFRDPTTEKTNGDFVYQEVKNGEATIAKINGLTDKGASKNDIVIPTKIGSYETAIAPNSFRSYRNIKTVVFEGDIDVVPLNAFLMNENLNSVTFKSVERIESKAFSGTTLLKTLNLGSPVILNYIGEYAFEKTGLETFIMPDSVQTIEAYAFSNAKSLKTLKLSSQLIKIEPRSFDSCTALSGTLDIPRNVVSIGAYSFNSTNLTGLNVPSDSILTTIGKAAFINAPIPSVKLPKQTIIVTDSFNSNTVITRY